MEQSKFYQIKNVTEHEYTLVGCDGSVITRPIQDVDKSASAFTIADAKDGDVLVMQKTDVTYESIFIFKKIENNRIIQYLHYFTTDADEEVCEARSIDGFLGFVGTTVHPATKEQRDLLFAKMHEAGYTWNPDEKKLEKIKQKSSDSYCREHCKGYQETGKCFADEDCDAKRKADNKQWSEEDEANFQCALSYINGNPLLEDVNMENCISWLKSLKDRVQPKQEWSEDDEKMYRMCVDAVEYYHTPEDESVVRDWLKSLKDRYAWKPSDEQMDALEHFVRSTGESGYASPYDNNTKFLYSLLFDLKKLKEE